MATRTILFRGQTRRKGERTSISGIPLPGIWVAGGVFPQNKGYDYAIIYQQNPKVEKYVVYADTIGQYTGINDSLGNFIRQTWMGHAMLLTFTTSTTIWMMVTALWWTILSTMMLSTHSMSMTLSMRRFKHAAS